ncbi:hypothetical protein ONS95_012212 [Cadophora gregata]|nr:uncharacterized protein ONS95_012212 [Cadophora gregata]KAK0117895.1 hypothetical protein ONS95_012212 [Cadophora gregata]KAK0122956.1 hypothetical protein ONS96_009977 [Cadophora gregata f. sp. sojae]
MDDAATSQPLPAATSGRSKKKPKTFRCRFCPDIFHRLEHIQRHERTHTKEKPFSCSCGKAFARRDILLRHEKLVHDEGVDRDDGRSRPSLAATIPSPVTTHASVDTNRLSSEWTSHNSSFPSTFAPPSLSNNTPVSSMSQPAFFSGQFDPEDENIASLPPVYVDRHDFIIPDAVDIPGDYNLFFDNFDISNFYLPATVYDSELPVSLWSRPNNVHDVEQHQNMDLNSISENTNDATGHFDSPPPLQRSEDRTLMGSKPRPQADFLRAGPPWKVSGQDYRTIQDKLKDFVGILPKDFILPTRHTLSRYFEGYITGFNQHLPFLHIPSFSVSKFVPELVLAIAAVGAQYRFENARGNKLWYAAKSVATEQIKKRQSHQVADILSSPTPRSASLSKSPVSNTSPDDIPTPRPNHSYVAAGRSSKDDIWSPSSQARLGTIQTLLIMMAMGMWGPPPLLREATSIQNQLALLIREHGLQTVECSESQLRWEDWVLFESDRRTKCIAYCFFNLHSIAYDNPPILRTSELKLNLPHSAEEWRAASAEDWESAKRSSSQVALSFHHALSKLFSTDEEDLPPISSLGNYVLIHAIIQQIYIIRQASTISIPAAINGSLQAAEISKLGQVLRIWQIGWEKAPESSLDPMNPYGPVAFSSTALLRLAYIRLHCDLGPCRGLETRDPQVIARTLKACPPLTRSPLMSRAILQAAHALSIPVKIGIKFVAHTHTLLWSMQHSLGNLECAFLLSRWLYMISESMEDLTIDERNLLEMVRSIVCETHFAVESEDGRSMEGSMGVRKLSVAVVRIWAEVFNGSHHVFPLVKVIGLALEGYADMCELEDESAA